MEVVQNVEMLYKEGNMEKLEGAVDGFFGSHYIYTPNVFDNYVKLLHQACKDNNVEAVKIFLFSNALESGLISRTISSFRHDMMRRVPTAFSYATLYGGRDLVSYLDGISGIGSRQREFGVRRACWNNNLEVLKWFNTRHPLTLRRVATEASIDACHNGHIEILNFLGSLNMCNITMYVQKHTWLGENHPVNVSQLWISCHNGHLEAAKWAHERLSKMYPGSLLYDDNKRKKEYNQSWQSAASNGHLHIVEWMISIGVEIDKPILIRNLIKSDSTEALDKFYPLLTKKERLDYFGNNAIQKGLLTAAKANATKSAEWMIRKAELRGTPESSFDLDRIGKVAWTNQWDQFYRWTQDRPQRPESNVFQQVDLS